MDFGHTAQPRTRSASGRGPIARLLTGFWMAVQVLVVAVAPVADSQLLHSSDVVAHWEGEGAECPSSHGADACQLCQLLVAPRDLPATGAAAVFARGETERVPAGHERAAGLAARLNGLGSRAPPRA